jgi:hypothetical protein
MNGKPPNEADLGAKAVKRRDLGTFEDLDCQRPSLLWGSSAVVRRQPLCLHPLNCTGVLSDTYEFSDDDFFPP